MPAEGKRQRERQSLKFKRCGSKIAEDVPIASSLIALANNPTLPSNDRLPCSSPSPAPLSNRSRSLSVRGTLLSSTPDAASFIATSSSSSAICFASRATCSILPKKGRRYGGVSFGPMTRGVFRPRCTARTPFSSTRVRQTSRMARQVDPKKAREAHVGPRRNRTPREGVSTMQSPRADPLKV